MAKTYDLVIIGSGTAAQVASARVRAAGWEIAVIDHRPFGGTCALRGCDPKKMLISGAGAHVTVLQRAERMLPAFDPDLVGWLMEKFGELGIDVRTRSTVQRIEKVANGFLVHASTDGQMQTMTADLVVHAAGRAPDLDTLDRPCARLLAAAGLAEAPAPIGES
jgi:pyruvate/2-oxoglutarate dehydrogenase complex dihydrolipoamide dehydrogenase (E3) component